MRKIKIWTESEIEFLKANYQTLSFEEIAKSLNRTVKSVTGKCHLLGLRKRNKQPRYTEEEIKILISNQGMTINEVSKLLNNRSISSIDYKIKELGLNYNIRTKQSIEGNIVKCSKCQNNKEFNSDNFYVDKNLLICKKCLVKIVFINKLKRKGILLDFNKLLDTYTPEEWVEFILKGNIKKYPQSYITKEILIRMLRYVVNIKLNRTVREEIIKTTRNEIKKYALNSHISNHFNGWYEAISTTFSELEIKPFELFETPKGYWLNKSHADEYMIWLVGYLINNNNIQNIEKELPQYLSHTYLRDIKQNKAIDCLHLYKHYKSMYEWMSTLYPNLNFNQKDFSTYVSNDGKTELDSLEEKYIYDFILENFPNITLIATGRKRKNNTYFNDKYNESYSPDFKIIDENKKVRCIIEYFGFYNLKNEHHVFKDYIEKADRKTDYFNNLEDIYFIDLYPIDLNNNFEGVRNKLMPFLLSS